MKRDWCIDVLFWTEIEEDAITIWLGRPHMEFISSKTYGPIDEWFKLKIMYL